jgi:hypothetical protein
MNLVGIRSLEANRFWMLLSGNAEVAFPSRNTTIAAAANLSTSVATAATVDVAPVVATTPSTTSAPNVVASASGQKRKSHKAALDDMVGVAYSVKLHVQKALRKALEHQGTCATTLHYNLFLTALKDNNQSAHPVQS